jgi:hypothetical protein
MAKEKAIRMVTPTGLAHYPWLTEPDTKFKPEGEYHTGLILTVAEAEPLIEKLTQMTDEYFANAYNEAKPNIKKKMVKHFPWEHQCDDNGNETGNIIMKFKTSAQFSDKKTGEVITKTLPVFDAYGAATTKSVWGGSKIVINFTPAGFSMPSTGMTGFTLYLNAVQVLEFAAGSGGGSSDDFGFKAESPPPPQAMRSDADEEDIPF